MMNKFEVTIKGYALAQNWTPEEFKAHLEIELRKLKVIMKIKEVKVKPVKDMFTRRDLV